MAKPLGQGICKSMVTTLLVPSGLVDTLPICAPLENAMRIHFANSMRPKKASKALSQTTGQPLSACQQAIAKSCGYRDWHDMEDSILSESGQQLHLEPSRNEVIEQEVLVAASTTNKLSANAGDVQYALSKNRLVGNHPLNFEESLEIRRRLFELNELPQANRREKGAIGKLKVAGRNGEHVILRDFGRLTRVITHKSADSTVADFEYISPRDAPPLFIPMRLYLPYGCWTEPDGAKVLFSRDYMPLWRLRDGQTPERIDPWHWIKFVHQEWFWNDSTAPWHIPTTYSAEIARLKAFGVRGLPILVEALPIVVYQDETKDFKNAVPLLQKIRQPTN